MKILFKCLFFTVFAITLSNCSRRVVNTNGKKSTNYSSSDYEENLSSVRPRYDEKPTPISTNDRKSDREKPVVLNEIPLEVNTRVNAVLDTIANQNKSIKFAQGYRIQVYVGNNRQDVDDAKAYISQNFPELNIYMAYNQPTYKMKAGDFMYRMDAEKYFGSIKQQFSGATIVVDRIDIRKSLLAK